MWQASLGRQLWLRVPATTFTEQAASSSRAAFFCSGRYRQKVQRLHAALAEPAIHDEAIAILSGLIERVVIHRSGTELEVELVGEIVRMVELGAGGRHPGAVCTSGLPRHQR